MSFTFINQNGTASKYNDYSAGKAIQELKTNHNIQTQAYYVKGPTQSLPITKDDMLEAIMKGVSDLDGKATTAEYQDFKKFFEQNQARLTPEAKGAFKIYEKYVLRAQSQGRSGLSIPELRLMKQDMQNYSLAKIISISLPPMQSVLIPQGSSIVASNNGYVINFPGNQNLGAAPAWSNIDSFNTTADQQFINAQNQRISQQQQFAAKNQESEKIRQQLMAALQSGNIDLAMLLFSSLENREANQMVSMLTNKLVDLQQNRKNMMMQMDQTTGDQKKINSIQANVQENNDTIQILTSFIKEISEQKNRTSEFANNYLNSDHQTTMSIIRGR